MGIDRGDQNFTQTHTHTHIQTHTHTDTHTHTGWPFYKSFFFFKKETRLKRVYEISSDKINKLTYEQALAILVNLNFSKHQ